MAAMEIGEDTPMLLPHQSMCRTARSRKKRHEYVSHESGPWVVVLKVYESKTWKEGNTPFFEELDYMTWDFQSCWVRSMMTWISMFLFWRLFLHVFYMSLKMPNLPFLLWEGIHYTQFFQICFLLHFQPKNMFSSHLKHRSLWVHVFHSFWGVAILPVGRWVSRFWDPQGRSRRLYSLSVAMLL